MGLQGATYTLFNKQGTRTRERIDKSCCSMDWLNSHPTALVHHPPAACSDYCPILIKLWQLQKNLKKNFKFESLWVQDDSYHTILSTAWREDKIEDLNQKVESFKKDISWWLANHLSNLACRIHKKREELGKVHAQPPSEDSLLREATISPELNKLNAKEAFWRQRSKNQEIFEGDKNTKYFHSTMLQRRGRNRITSVLDAAGTVNTTEVN